MRYNNSDANLFNGSIENVGKQTSEMDSNTNQTGKNCNNLKFCGNKSRGILEVLPHQPTRIP